MNHRGRPTTGASSAVIQGFLVPLSRASIAWPSLALLAVGTLALVGAAGIVRLELRTDGHALVPPDHPTTVFDAEVRRVFGRYDPILVHIETTHPDGIYNPDSMRRVQALSDRLSELVAIGPERVMSLATEASPRVYPGTLDFRTFLDPPPETPERIAELRGDVATVRILTGTLVSEDERATTILRDSMPRLVRHKTEFIDSVLLVTRDDYRHRLANGYTFSTRLSLATRQCKQPFDG